MKRTSLSSFLSRYRLAYKDPVEEKEYARLQIPLIKDFFQVTSL